MGDGLGAGILAELKRLKTLSLRSKRPTWNQQVVASALTPAGGNDKPLSPEEEYEARQTAVLRLAEAGKAGVDVISGATLEHVPNPVDIILVPVDPTNPNTPVIKELLKEPPAKKSTPVS